MQSKSDVDGTLGNNFLKRFNMIIDFKTKELYLQPNNYFWTPFYDFLVEQPPRNHTSKPVSVALSSVHG